MHLKQKYSIFFMVLFVFTACKTTKTTFDTSANYSPEIIQQSEGLKIGIDNHELYMPLLAHKKVGVVTNATGIIYRNHQPIHLVDFLVENEIQVTQIFAPEHGFRGTADAGEVVNDTLDIKTNLPIISLYGNNKKPKPEQLKDLDVLVFDIQDVGVRFYTYISTLHLVMEACAEQQIPLIVLDRPNPNANIVDGPVLEPEFKSFVGMHSVPILYGMTIGEYAKMIQGEGWLPNSLSCNLTIIPCKNYHRNIPNHLPIKPSPNLPNDKSINLYASLCLFEGTNVSVGRGTEVPFQVYGSPFLPETTFSFVPMPTLGAKDPLHKGKKCFGENLRTAENLHQLELKWLLYAYQNTADKSTFFNSFFTKLAGTKTLQTQIEQGITEDEIRNSWNEALEKFKTIRQKYLLY